jgi:integrase
MKITLMATKRLALPRGKREAIHFDDDIPGFGLRLREGGSSSWVFQYKIGSKHRRVTFGKYPAVDATKARELAADLHAKVRLGQDPAGAKANARARANETFKTCARQYLVWQQKRVRSSTYKENERHLLKNLAPLHGLRVDTTDKRSIAAQLTRLSTEAGPVQANRTRASLSKFFNWCLREGLVDANPAALTNVTAEKKRDRVLANDELAEIWEALPANDFGTILKLLILTGQRKREIADLRWPEVNLDRGVIALPARRAKNRREHAIPLSVAAAVILDKQMRREGRDLVFGVGHGGFGGWSKAKSRLDQAIFEARKKANKKAKPMEPWIVHDLRRAVATGMAEIGVQPHVIEAVLNHVSGHKAGVAGIYNKATYQREKAAALALWADHIQSIAQETERKIVPLRHEQV